MLHLKRFPGFWIHLCNVHICEAWNGNFESQEMQKYVQYEMYQHCEWIKLFKLTSHISYLTRCIPQIIFHMHFTCLNKVKMERCLPLGTRISETEYLDNLCYEPIFSLGLYVTCIILLFWRSVFKIIQMYWWSTWNCKVNPLGYINIFGKIFSKSMKNCSNCTKQVFLHITSHTHITLVSFRHNL